MNHPILARSRRRTEQSRANAQRAMVLLLGQTIETYFDAPAGQTETPIFVAAQRLDLGHTVTTMDSIQATSREFPDHLRDAVDLVALAWSGCALDADAQQLFFDLGTKALARLADALCVKPADYSTRWLFGETSASGDLQLITDLLSLDLTFDQIAPGQELAATRNAIGNDRPSPRFVVASICELLRPDVLAARIRRELGFSEICLASVQAVAAGR